MDTTGNKKAAPFAEKTIAGAYGSERVSVTFMPKTNVFPDRIFLSSTFGPLMFQFGMLPDQARQMAASLIEMADAIQAIQAAECAPDA